MYSIGHRASGRSSMYNRHRWSKEHPDQTERLRERHVRVLVLYKFGRVKLETLKVKLKLIKGQGEIKHRLLHVENHVGERNIPYCW